KDEGPRKRGANAFEEKPGGYFQAATRVEQKMVFARDLDTHAEVLRGCEVVDDERREIVGGKDEFSDAEGQKARARDFDHDACGDVDEGFRADVGQGTQARAETRGEDHGFHGEPSGEWRVTSDEKRKKRREISLRKRRAMGRRSRCARNDGLRKQEAA